jgi:cysteine desulfurase/selenocysteine lyase
LPSIGFGAAVDFLSAIAWRRFTPTSRELLAYALPLVAEIPESTCLGRWWGNGGGLSFWLEPRSADISALWTRTAFATAPSSLRAPLHERFGLPSSARASCYLYNDKKM